MMLCIHQPTCILFNKVRNLPNKDCFTLKLIFPITELVDLLERSYTARTVH